MNSTFPLSHYFADAPSAQSARSAPPWGSTWMELNGDARSPEQIVNFRDLSSMDPDHVAGGIVFRSAVPVFATPSDRRMLQTRNVTQIIDLRSDDEVAMLPSIDDLGGCVVRHVPMMVTPWNMEKLISGQPIGDYLAEEYSRMLIDSGERIRLILDLITDHDGATLIHCTAGKDRTGIIVALLGVIAAAPIQCIVDDYSVSAHAMPALLDLLREAAKLHQTLLPIHFNTPHHQQLFFASPSGAIEQALATLFPSPHRYFDEIGYSRNARRHLQARLLKRTSPGR